jgi:3',5'-cyclic AMP phosphodiesterase CpdA
MMLHVSDKSYSENVAGERRFPAGGNSTLESACLLSAGKFSAPGDRPPNSRLDNGTGAFCSISMPGILFENISRRRFVDVSSKVIAALALTSRTGVAVESPLVFHVALLSDIHIAANALDENRKFRPTDNLKAVLPQVLAARPEGMIINGDLARMSGESSDYEAIKGLLAPASRQAPVYLVLGNHDDRTNFSKAFDKPSGERQQIENRHVLVIEHPFVRLILLDSLLFPTKTPGFLGMAQRQWLGRYLRETDGRPTMLFVHHTLGDDDGSLLDADRLFEVIRPHRKVKAIFYGHSHVYSYGRHQGVHLVNLPALGYNFSDSEPVGWVDAKFHPDGVKLCLHAIGGNRKADGEVQSLPWGS